MKFKLTPSHRITLAYFTGVLATSITIMIPHFDNTTMTVVAWVVSVSIAVLIHIWNVRTFEKETLWMTIKNPSKATFEEGDVVNPVIIRPIKPPPPPNPPPKSK